MENRTRKLQTRSLIVVTIAIFTDMFIYGLIVPIIPAYALSLGMSQTSIGFLFGCYALALLLATPFFGWLSDRVGRRGPLLGGLLGLFLATLLFAFASNFWVLVAARILQGIAAAATWTAGLALLADVFPLEERGKSMGIAMSGMVMGTLIGPALGGFLFDHGGYRLPFLLAAGLVFIDGILRLVLLQDATESTVEKAISSPFQLLNNRIILSVCIVVLFGAGISSLLEPTFPIFLKKSLGASPTVIGLLFIVPPLAYGLSAPLIGWVSDRFGRIWPMIMGVILLGVFLPLIGLANNIILEIGALLLFGVSMGLTLAPTMPELTNATEQLKSKSYGMVLALYNLTYFLGLACGPIIGSTLTNAFGFFIALLSIGVVTLLCGCVLIFSLQQV